MRTLPGSIGPDERTEFRMAPRSLLAALPMVLALGACAERIDRAAQIDASAQLLVTEKIEIGRAHV